MEPMEEVAAAAAIESVLGNDDLLAEILLRLVSPTWLVRAAAVSKRWLRRASDPGVLRRFRVLHPPRVLAVRALGQTFPVRPTSDLVDAWIQALLTLCRGADGVCDVRDGRLLVELGGRDPAEFPAYAVRSLILPARDAPIPSPPRMHNISLPCRGSCNGRLLNLLHGDSCLCLDLTYSSELFGAEYSVLRSGAWSAPRSAVTELRQPLTMDVIGAQKQLVGTRFYTMTALGYILGLDLATASFFHVQLPDDARNNAKFSGGSGPRSEVIYLVDAKGLQLRVWRGDAAGQWELVDTVCVREACRRSRLDVRRWKRKPGGKGRAAPLVKVVAVTDNAEFVVLELVASGIVCCMQVSNRVVEKVSGESLGDYTGIVRPVTMLWPPVFPAVDKANQYY